MQFKKLLTLSLFTLSFVTAYGQSNTFPSSGRVGIGTTTPGTLLHLQAQDSREQFRMQSGGNGSAYFDMVFAVNNTAGFTTGSADSWVLSHRKDGYFTGSTGGTSLEFYAHKIGGGYFAPLSFKSNGDVVLVSSKNATTANVGIGINFPRAKLDVMGGIKAKTMDLGFYGDTGYIGKLFLSGTRNEHVYGQGGELEFGGGYGTRAKVLLKHTGGHAQTWLAITSTDETYPVRVGIGTSTPDAPLTVAGNIHAREIKVTATAGGADFVFADDYTLPKLEVVAAFIKQNKHLPEIPSAAEMEANGLHLAEMNIKLLQKVEELTLYVIEQQQQMEKMQQEIEELKIKNNHK